MFPLIQNAYCTQIVNEFHPLPCWFYKICRNGFLEEVLSKSTYIFYV